MKIVNNFLCALNCKCRDNNFSLLIYSTVYNFHKFLQRLTRWLMKSVSVSAFHKDSIGLCRGKYKKNPLDRTGQADFLFGRSCLLEQVAAEGFYVFLGDADFDEVVLYAICEGAAVGLAPDVGGCALVVYPAGHLGLLAF